MKNKIFLNFYKTTLKWLNKIIRIKDNPRLVSLGFALGLFIGMTPFFGGHTILALIFASLFRVNRIAAILGIFITNPLTITFIYPVNYLVGLQFFPNFDIPLPTAFNFATLTELFRNAPELIYVLSIGGAVLGIPLSIFGYVFINWLLKRYNSKRNISLKRFFRTKRKKIESPTN